MAKQDVSGIQVTNTVQCVGTIDSVNSIKSNGGGWKFSATLSDPDIIAELAKGLKKVCVITVGISENKGGEDDNGQLALGDAVPEPEED
jgi:hypothetical protein